MSNVQRICGSTWTANGKPCRLAVASGASVCGAGHVPGSRRPDNAEILDVHLPGSDMPTPWQHLNTKELAKLALQDDNHQAARLAVRRPDIPAGVLGQFARSSDSSISQAALRHPKCPSEVLEEMAVSPHAEQRRSVACNPGTPSAALNRMAIAEDDPVALMMLAGNPASPEHTVVTLFKSVSSPAVQAAALANPRFPDDLLTEAADSASDPDVRRAAMDMISVRAIDRRPDFDFLVPTARSAR